LGEKGAAVVAIYGNAPPRETRITIRIILDEHGKNALETK